MIPARCNSQLLISVVRRDFEAEANIMQAAKCDFLIRAGSADDVAEIMSGRVENPNIFIFNNERNRIVLDTPAYPMHADFTAYNLPISPACMPLMMRLSDINYGREEEVLFQPVLTPFPMLRLMDFTLGNQCRASSGCDELDFSVAKRFASELGVTNAWDELAVKKGSLQWKPSKVQAEQESFKYYSGWRGIVPVSDNDSVIRHLMYLGIWEKDICVLLPLSFAQHHNYSKPLPCYFTFDPGWWLMNSNHLQLYPDAEVLITNELGVTLSNEPKKDRIILGYFFGPEMIPFLHLDCLHGRKVKFLFVHSSDPKRFKRNVKEAILLLARLEKLGIEASCYIVKDEFTCLGAVLTYHGIEFPLEKRYYAEPVDFKLPDLLQFGRELSIPIPENLRPDRFDALTTELNTPLVHDLLTVGGVTAIRAHSGCNLPLFTVSILVGMMNGGNVFSGRWKIEPNRKIRPIVFIPQTTNGRYNRLMKEIWGGEPFTFYPIPAGSEKEIEQRFSDIRRKTDGNVVILAASNLVSEYKNVLETACIWAQKERLGLMICASEDSPSAETFLTDRSERDIHIWRVSSPEISYILEDRDPLNRDWNFFKLTLANGQWITKEVDSEEIKNIEGRKIAVQNYNAVNPEKIDARTLDIIQGRNKK